MYDVVIDKVFGGLLSYICCYCSCDHPDLESGFSGDRILLETSQRNLESDEISAILLDLCVQCTAPGKGHPPKLPHPQPRPVMETVAPVFNTLKEDKSKRSVPIHVHILPRSLLTSP